MARESGGGRTCETVTRRLSESFLAREAPAAADLEHARGCVACAAHRDDLTALTAAFETAPSPDLRPEIVAATRRRAAALLPGQPVAVPDAPHPIVATFAAARRAPPPLPERFRRELARLIAGSLAPLPLVLAWNAAVVLLLGRLLRPVLPELALYALGLAYALSFVFCLNIVYG